MVFWLAHLKAPSVGISSIEMNALNLKTPPPYPIDVVAGLWIDNPNGWPLSAEVVSARADVYSLDKKDDGAEPFYIGQLTLPDSVTIATHANTSFNVELKGDIQKGQDALVARLNRDCYSGGGDRTTMVEVNLTNATVSFWHKQYNLDDLELSFNATIPCPNSQSASALTKRPSADQSDAATIVRNTMIAV